MSRDELVEAVAQALSDAWKEGTLLSQNKPGGRWFSDYEKFAAVAIDIVEPLIRADERANPRDEYHTMEELYEYRMLYNAAFANVLSHLSFSVSASKSYRHSDGELCFGGGWFVVYLDLPTGQISNHYENQYWDLFRVPEVASAPEWDGHTPAEAAERLRQYCLGT